jgi:hypothetical protein
MTRGRKLCDEDIIEVACFASFFLESLHAKLSVRTQPSGCGLESNCRNGMQATTIIFTHVQTCIVYHLTNLGPRRGLPFPYVHGVNRKILPLWQSTFIYRPSIEDILHTRTISEVQWPVAGRISVYVKERSLFYQDTAVCSQEPSLTPRPAQTCASLDAYLRARCASRSYCVA